MAASGGSIPWACVGLVAFSIIVLVRLVSLRLAGTINSNEEVKAMGKRTRLPNLFGFSALESTWAIAAAYAGGTLPT